MRFWVYFLMARISYIISIDLTSMTSKPGEQQVDEGTRDKLFAELRGINENNICLDCEKKNPKWASIHLGIHLCLDCAGKHRQYGVVYSFVKSINLDAWNQKQLLYMQKGGNTRALEYFRKRGVITANNRHIDYKSAIVQQYKALLTEQVDLQLQGGGKAKQLQPEKKAINDFFNQMQNQNQVEQKKVQIPVATQVVEQVPEKTKKGKGKKKIGAKQISIDNFESLAFDDGVPIEEKDKIVKEYEKKIDVIETSVDSTGTQVTAAPVVKIEEPKQLSQEEVKKKMEELKLQTNLKAISSEQFKDTSIDNVTLKQNLNKFSTSTSISSSAFFNKQQQQPNQTIQNIKGVLTNAGQKIFTKLSGYWKQ